MERKSTRWHAWCLAVLVISAAAMGQSAAERISVKEILGKVEVRRPKTEAWRAARTGMPVKIGWDIRTYVESSAELLFASGTVLKISENSVVTLNNAMVNPKAGVSNSSVKVATGQVWANVKKLTNAKSTFDFETPTAVASIRGTVLDLRVGRNGDQINVYEGLVMVRRRGGGREVPVPTGKGAVISSTGGEISLVTISAKGDTTAVPDSSAAGSDTTAASQDSTASAPDTAASAPDTTVAAPDTTASAPDTAAAAPQTPEPDTSTVPQDNLPPVDSTESAESAPPADTVAAEQVDTTASTESVAPEAVLVLKMQEPSANAIVSEPNVVVKGSVTPGARVQVNGEEANVGSDGGFAQLAELKIGTNAIAVSASLGSQNKKMETKIDYRPELFLNVTNLVDGMEVTSAQLHVEVEVAEGARFSVNGRTGVTNVDLKMGENTITVRAFDRWNNSLDQTFRVQLRPAGAFELAVVKPTEGMTLEEPMIPVSGSTSPGAKVSVRGSAVQVNDGGYFSTQLPIPDEPREYTIAIIATLGDDEQTVERTVVYRPRRKELFLDITSPTNGQDIKASPLRVQGLTAPGAKIMVNGRPATGWSPSGVFTHDIPLNESMIGDLVLDITAEYAADEVNDMEEVSESRSVTIDVSSPQINTSKPRLVLGNLTTKKADKACDQPIQVTDNTLDDEIRIEIENNGTREVFTVDPGGRETYCFEDGRNTFAIQAFDKARNSSTRVAGELYVLRGPLTITVLEPESEQMTIDDLPPMPRGVPNPKMAIEVEIDDGIGDVPETIRYVRIIENGAVLKDNQDYTFSTQVNLRVNRLNTFTLQAEDLAGNKATQQITVDLRQ